MKKTVIGVMNIIYFQSNKTLIGCVKVALGVSPVF